MRVKAGKCLKGQFNSLTLLVELKAEEVVKS